MILFHDGRRERRQRFVNHLFLHVKQNAALIDGDLRLGFGNNDFIETLALVRQLLWEWS